MWCLRSRDQKPVKKKFRLRIETLTPHYRECPCVIRKNKITRSTTGYSLKSVWTKSSNKKRDSHLSIMIAAKWCILSYHWNRFVKMLAHLSPQLTWLWCMCPVYIQSMYLYIDGSIRVSHNIDKFPAGTQGDALSWRSFIWNWIPFVTLCFVIDSLSMFLALNK